MFGSAIFGLAVTSAIEQIIESFFEFNRVTGYNQGSYASAAVIKTTDLF